MDQDYQDTRLGDTDHRLIDRLDTTPPSPIPAGLVDRVLQASMPALMVGRARDVTRLRWPVVVGRLAVAAMLGVAVVIGFWSTPSGSTSGTFGLPLTADLGDQSSTAMLASGPFEWRDGPLLTLLAVKDVGYEQALGDLETVVHTVGTGRMNMLGLVDDEGPHDRVEAELLTVTSVAGGAS